ncbi:MAG: hypothetical protein R3272_12390 [Candidatus Promineifilaceae bacterium]|nr:hypothetical protein [Candidatus Promineifilaceae bacterium]
MRVVRVGLPGIRVACERSGKVSRARWRSGEVAELLPVAAARSDAPVVRARVGRVRVVPPRTWAVPERAARFLLGERAARVDAFRARSAARTGEAFLPARRAAPRSAA